MDGLLLVCGLGLIDGLLFVDGLRVVALAGIGAQCLFGHGLRLREGGTLLLLIQLQGLFAHGGHPAGLLKRRVRAVRLWARLVTAAHAEQAEQTALEAARARGPDVVGLPAQQPDQPVHDQAACDEHQHDEQPVVAQKGQQAPVAAALHERDDAADGALHPTEQHAEERIGKSPHGSLRYFASVMVTATDVLASAQLKAGALSMRHCTGSSYCPGARPETSTYNCTSSAVTVWMKE